MSRYFDRKLMLEIGEPGEEGKRIEDLRVEFDITLENSENSNKANLTVYNPSDDTLGRMQGDNAIVRVIAGYEDNFGTIFSGFIRRATKEFGGTDIPVEIEAEDGGLSLRQASVQKTFSKGQDAAQAIGDVAATLDSPSDDLEVSSSKVASQVRKKASGSTTFPSSFTASGSTKIQLTQMLDRFDLTFTIDRGTLKVTEKDKGIGDIGVLLSPDSGLIGNPSQTEKNVVKVTSLLNPALQVEGLIKIESERIPTGFYRIERIDFKGNNEDGDFFAELDCSPEDRG